MNIEQETSIVIETADKILWGIQDLFIAYNIRESAEVQDNPAVTFDDISRVIEEIKFNQTMK